MNDSSDTKTVIIVDDEVNIVSLLVDIMESAGYRAIGCSVWTEAMNAINRDSPDLVLLDLKMPTIDGPSMLEFIRGEGLDVPVIVVSGFVTDQVSEDLNKLGVSAFVNKPFRAAEILRQVRTVLDATTTAPPASMNALYESTGEPAAASTGDHPSETNQLLAALQKLDGGTTAPAPAPASDTSAPDNDVLAALKRNEPSAAPPPLPAKSASAETAEVPPATPHDPSPAVSPSRPPEHTFTNDLLGGTDSQLGPTGSRDGSSDLSVSVTGHRRHHRPPPRRRRFTKRNFILFGSMFVICVVVAGFMAAMNWYAAQIDVDEIKKNTEKAITKQATQEIMQQLKDSRP